MTIHSVYGASGSNIYMACNMSIAMSRGKANHTNEPAEQGTAAHELGEFCLKLGLNAYDLIGQVFNKSTSFPKGFMVDQEMADAVQLYISHIRMIAAQFGVDPMLEVKVVMYSVREDVFGTADCVFIIGDTIYVIDYKHGWGIVEVVNNSQAIFYAIAVMDTYNLWTTVTTIKTAIIQPRPDHADAAIRYQTYLNHELHPWVQSFRSAILTPSSVPQAGKHCTYCLARDTCRTRLERTVRLAYGDKPLEEVSADELLVMYNETKSIKKHLDSVLERMVSMARSGHDFGTLKLVTARKFAFCSDKDEFISAAIKSGVEEDDLYKPRELKSMTECKKSVNKNIVNHFFIKPPADSTLVPLNDSRPAISKSAVGTFGAIS